MALSCLTWNNGKPCVWFDLKLNCCADPVDYVSSEGGLQVCRYHQYAVEGKTSEQGESPATDRQHTQLAIAARAVIEAWDGLDDSGISNSILSLRNALQQQAGA